MIIDSKYNRGIYPTIFFVLFSYYFPVFLKFHHKYVKSLQR